MWTTSFTGVLSLEFFSEAVQRMQGLLKVLASQRSPQRRRRKTACSWAAAAAARLPDKYRAAVLLTYGAELPLEEVARIEKLPKGTVKSRLHKARLLLKKEMEARGYGREEL